MALIWVSLIHLAESRSLFFLEAEIVNNIFQWDAIKNMRQIKSYDDMFHVECKIAQDNDCLFSSFKEKGKYCMSFKKVYKTRSEAQRPV